MLPKFLQPVRDFFTSGVPARESGALAAGSLPDLVDPKVKSQPQSQPSYSKRTKTSTGDIRLAETDRQTANLDLLTLRNGVSTKATVRDLSKVSPDLSAAIWAYQRLVVTKGYSAVARNQDGTAEPTATAALQAVLSRMDYLTDYAQGFNNITSIHAAAEAMCKELRYNGSCALELVLDKALMPSRLQPIATTQIRFNEAKDGTSYPVQLIGGVERPLDSPAFFYESLDQDLLSAYSDSPSEPALAATLADAEFTQDVRRVIKRALHPRINATIVTEHFMKHVPNDVKADPEKLKAYTNTFIADIATTINGLQVDDALVHFDSVLFDYLNNGNVTLDKEYSTLQEMINAKLATGTGAPPAVLGHGSGSANIASTETMMFLRYCSGVQLKINSILSRALTLGVRLLGFDVYVQFAFDDIDLRPVAELEAFKAMKQSRTLELLSIGLISDEEASLTLTGKLPPKGFKPLMGTFFKTGSKDPEQVAADIASAKTNTGAVEQDLQPSTPDKPKGPAKRP